LKNSFKAQSPLIITSANAQNTVQDTLRDPEEIQLKEEAQEIPSH